MIFPEIALLWNVREGFEPSAPAMHQQQYGRIELLSGQLFPITPPHTTHRLFDSVRKAKAPCGTDIAMRFFLWYA